MGKGIGGHHRAYRGKQDEWITPKYIIDALGPFDLDPCAAVNQPWPTAENHLTKEANGLLNTWLPRSTRIWLNPPYGPETGKWLEKLASHGNGIALCFARTETRFFQEQVFQKADAILFLAGRLTFYTIEGRKAPHNSGGPSCLVAYGQENVSELMRCYENKLPGYLVQLNNAWQRIED